MFRLGILSVTRSGAIWINCYPRKLYSILIHSSRSTAVWVGATISSRGLVSVDGSVNRLSRFYSAYFSNALNTVRNVDLPIDCTSTGHCLLYF